MAKPEAKSKTPWANMEPRRRTALQWRQPMSQRARQPTWRDGRVSTGLSYPMHTQEDADTLLWMIIIVNLCWNYQPSGECWARTVLTTYYVRLLPDRQQMDDCITDIWFINHWQKKITNMFSGLQVILYHISVELPKQPFPLFIICIAFSYAGPALNYSRAGQRHAWFVDLFDLHVFVFSNVFSG